MSPSQAADEREAVGQWIEENRSRLDMTQRELANRLDTAEGLVRKWIKGKGFPSSRHYFALCDIFGTTPPHRELHAGQPPSRKRSSRRATEHIGGYLSSDIDQYEPLTPPPVNSPIRVLSAA